MISLASKTELPNLYRVFIEAIFSQCLQLKGLKLVTFQSKSSVIHNISSLLISVRSILSVDGNFAPSGSNLEKGD